MADTAARKRTIGGAFDRVAARYDRMCTLSPGYRKHLVWSAERLEAAPDARILDLACGTGLSTEALVAVYPRAEIIGVDVSPGMLAHARQKPRLRGVRFVEGDATALDAGALGAPFGAILSAYGIRNVPDPDACLRDLRALLEPGGALCLHEYSVRDSARARVVWNLVSLGIVVPLALAIVRSTEIFRYLRRSVLEFDGVRALEARLRDAGFEQVETLPMDGWQRGITHTFRGRVGA